MKLADKVVIITGVSSGIGEGVAKRFLEQGAKVMGCGIEPSMRINADNIHYIQADLTNFDNAQRVVDEAVKIFGRVDCVINCAGISKVQSLESADTQSFEHEFKVNVTGVFHMCKAAVAELKKSKQAAIVNIASDLGVRPIPERISYCPSKAAVIMLTKCIALEYAPHIRANCILPGLVETPMVTSRFSSDAELESFRNNMSQIYPLKKLGTIDDMAKAIIFLVSDDSTFITGESIGVCGGSLI